MLKAFIKIGCSAHILFIAIRCHRNYNCHYNFSFLTHDAMKHFLVRIDVLYACIHVLSLKAENRSEHNIDN